MIATYDCETYLKIFGFANYNRQFIKKYLRKTIPFINLIKKKQKFY